MNKPPVPLFTSADDVKMTVVKMGMGSKPDGPWWVWGDSKEPYLQDVDEATMKAYVDEGHAKGKLDLYGENSETNDIYEGGA